MKVQNYEIRKEKGTDDIITNIFCGSTTAPSVRYSNGMEQYGVLDNLYRAVCGMPDKDTPFTQWYNTPEVQEVLKSIEEGCQVVSVEEDKPTPEQILTNGINGLMKFFSEFNFQPNFRFLNTLSRYGKKEGRGYIERYFELTASPYTAVVKEKMKSQEFRAIEKDFFACKTDKQINTRFKLYYGSQGTGKTTIAMQESHDECMVCHNAMLPSDLMENFDFSDGKAEFQPSALYNAMVNGTPIVLDEINLLPFESLRFLQGILDGKKCLQYKDRTVNIAEGFMIIGTMNLTVNGMTYGLPEPLVDRCAETKRFELTAENLLGAVL
jgi:hypothetical protein